MKHKASSIKKAGAFTRRHRQEPCKGVSKWGSTVSSHPGAIDDTFHSYSLNLHEPYLSQVPSTACIHDWRLATVVAEHAGAHQTPTKKKPTRDDTARNRETTQQSHLISNQRRKGSSEQSTGATSENNPNRVARTRETLLLKRSTPEPKNWPSPRTTAKPSHHEARRTNRHQNRHTSRAENFPGLNPKPRSVSISTETRIRGSNSEGETKQTQKVSLRRRYARWRAAGRRSGRECFN